MKRDALAVQAGSGQGEATGGQGGQVDQGRCETFVFRCWPAHHLKATYLASSQGRNRKAWLHP